MASQMGRTRRSGMPPARPNLDAMKGRVLWFGERRGLGGGFSLQKTKGNVTVAYEREREREKKGEGGERERRGRGERAEKSNPVYFVNLNFII